MASEDPITSQSRGSRPKTSGTAIVKAVVSGDSFVLMGGSIKPGQLPAEKQVTLSGITAPRFGRGKNGTDEAFAWHSREFLRKQCIGQAVFFSINHIHEEKGIVVREYANVTLKDGTNLAHSMVTNGWATVKVQKNGNVHKERQELLDLQAEAKKLGSGQWNKHVNEEDFIRDIDWYPDARALFSQKRGVPIPAVVDQVREGSTLRCELLDPNMGLTHTMINLHLAGVQCPRTPLPIDFRRKQYAMMKKEKPDSDLAEPVEEEAKEFALEAQFFTEARLLHRDIQVLIQGVDKYNNFFGTVLYPKGNISVRILEMGLGRILEWSLQISGDVEKLRAAEAAAKSARKGIWQSHDESAAPQTIAGPLRSFFGKVVSIISGDTLMINDGTGDKIYTLASIRAPRNGNPRRGDKPQPYAWEAKEFLRSRLIGKKVQVQVEYTRSGRGGETREHISIFQNKQNLSTQLLASGFATVLTHRVEDDRAIAYNDYMDAEHQAVQGKRGVHGPKKIAKRIVDLTERFRTEAKEVNVDADATTDSTEKVAKGKKVGRNNNRQVSKAQTYLSSFKRNKFVTGVVEYCFSGSRMKIYVPKENCMISFVLGGLRTPQRGSAEGFDQLALQFTKSRCIQHNVKLEVRFCDGGDNFIGVLWINGQNLNVRLLEEGLAEINSFSAEKSNYTEQLLAAEEGAKAAKKGIWLNYVEKPKVVEAPKETEPEEKDYSEKSEFINVKVTEITDAANFFIQIPSEQVKLIENRMEEFTDAVGEGTAEEFEDDFEVWVTPNNEKGQKGKGYSANELYAGYFTEAGSWHRVKVLGITADGMFRVLFVDYGNLDVLSQDSLRPLPEELIGIKPLAVSCALACCKAPGKDYAQDAALALNDYVWDRDVIGKIECVDKSKKTHLTLWNDRENPVSINQALLQNGWCRIQERPPRSLIKMAESLEKDQQIAISNKVNIWEYGEVSDDEDEEVGRRRRDDGRVPLKSKSRADASKR